MLVVHLGTAFVAVVCCQHQSKGEVGTAPGHCFLPVVPASLACSTPGVVLASSNAYASAQQHTRMFEQRQLSVHSSCSCAVAGWLHAGGENRNTGWGIQI